MSCATQSSVSTFYKGINNWGGEDFVVHCYDSLQRDFRTLFTDVKGLEVEKEYQSVHFNKSKAAEYGNAWTLSISSKHFNLFISNHLLKNESDLLIYSFAQHSLCWKYKDE